MERQHCPACGSVNTDTAHLLYEYREMLKGGFSRMFGPAARQAGNEIVDMLAARGVTEMPNAFGPMPLSKWKS